MRALLVGLLLATTAHAHRTPILPQVPATRPSDRAAIRKVVKKHLQQILICFEQDGLTVTKVDIDFAIGRTGKVTSTQSASAGSQSLQRCVASVFAKMTFPRRGAPVRVRYPVHICVAGQ